MFEYIHHVAYAVEDIEKGIAIFRDIFGLELADRRIVEHPSKFEMATFLCGKTRIELQRPIDHPGLEKFLKERGPGLSHVAYAVQNLPERIKELEAKGLSFIEPGIIHSGTGWDIADFDFEKCDIPVFKSPYHDDHLAAAEEEEKGSKLWQKSQ